MGGLMSMLFSFTEQKMELCIVGLENAGKSTLMNVLASGGGPGGAPAADTVPTVGLNVKVVKRGAVQMKMWDLAGQSAYRSEWSRYARGVDRIVFVVDVADAPRVAEARRELHRLLEDATLAHTPILIAANKVDISPHMAEAELIKELNLVRAAAVAAAAAAAAAAAEGAAGDGQTAAPFARELRGSLPAALARARVPRNAQFVLLPPPPPCPTATSTPHCRITSLTIPGLSCPSRQSTSRTWMSS